MALRHHGTHFSFHRCHIQTVSAHRSSPWAGLTACSILREPIIGEVWGRYRRDIGEICSILRESKMTSRPPRGSTSTEVPSSTVAPCHLPIAPCLGLGPGFGLRLGLGLGLGLGEGEGLGLALGGVPPLGRYPRVEPNRNPNPSPKPKPTPKPKPNPSPRLASRWLPPSRALGDSTS